MQWSIDKEGKRRKTKRNDSICAIEYWSVITDVWGPVSRWTVIPSIAEANNNKTFVLVDIYCTYFNTGHNRHMCTQRRADQELDKEPQIAVRLQSGCHATSTLGGRRAAEQNDPAPAPTNAWQKTGSKTRLVDTVLCICTSVFLGKNQKPTNQSAQTRRPQLQGAPERPKTLASSCRPSSSPPRR